MEKVKPTLTLNAIRHAYATAMITEVVSVEAIRKCLERHTIIGSMRYAHLCQKKHSSDYLKSITMTDSNVVTHEINQPHVSKLES